MLLRPPSHADAMLLKKVRNKIAGICVGVSEVAKYQTGNAAIIVMINAVAKILLNMDILFVIIFSYW